MEISYRATTMDNIQWNIWYVLLQLLLQFLLILKWGLVQKQENFRGRSLCSKSINLQLKWSFPWFTKIKKFPYLPTLSSVREGSLGEPQLFFFGLIKTCFVRGFERLWKIVPKLSSSSKTVHPNSLKKSMSSDVHVIERPGAPQKRSCTLFYRIYPKESIVY
jgi:hypothetical protein